MPVTRDLPLPGLPVPAPARRLDGDDVALPQLLAHLGRKPFLVEEVFAHRPGLPAGRPSWRVAATIAQEREASGLEYADGADDAVAAPVLAAAARAVEQLVALDAHRVLELKGLRGGVEGVAHADVDAGRSGTLAARALAAAYGLVVGPARAADDGVVHRPLALRREIRGPGEGGEHGVGDAVAGLHVAGHDRRRALRVHQATLRGLYLQRGVGAGVGRDVLGQEDPQGEVTG